jgi:hypothetical protein
MKPWASMRNQRRREIRFKNGANADDLVMASFLSGAGELKREKLSIG